MPDGSLKSVKGLKRDDILLIMDKMYECPDYYSFVNDEKIDTLDNDLIKALSKQIQNSLSDFQNNIPYLRHDVEESFPDLEESADNGSTV